MSRAKSDILHGFRDAQSGDTPPVPTARRPFGAARPRGGFTLVELIVASVIVALLASATTIAVSRSVKTRDASRARYDAFSRAVAAADLIARDLQNAARDENPTFVKLSLVAGGAPEAERDTIVMLASATRPTRGDPEIPEGPVSEVQFRLETSAGTPEPGGSDDVGTETLWRRADPLPDEFLDAGGGGDAGGGQHQIALDPGKRRRGVVRHVGL